MQCYAASRQIYILQIISYSHMNVSNSTNISKVPLHNISLQFWINTVQKFDIRLWMIQIYILLKGGNNHFKNKQDRVNICFCYKALLMWCFQLPNWLIQSWFESLADLENLWFYCNVFWVQSSGVNLILEFLTNCLDISK